MLIIVFHIALKNGSVGFIWYPHITTDSSYSAETLSEKKGLITKIKTVLSQRLLTYLCNFLFCATEIDKHNVDKVRTKADSNSFLFQCIL